ncbi:hypothetical protein [Clostridium sp. Cult2]|uniref:hypothetical protein n=1 Tax=Clostridium sp. Cult2 TaxID=2079003 RepID=UPI001F3E36FD|nr:hypothetical protein [Clostridium sp. Cult2]
MIILGIVATIIVGVFGSAIGYEMNFVELGAILSIATMGGFIMAEIRRNKK